MKIANTEIELVKGDITMLDVEAIVNPANSSMILAGGLAAQIAKRGGQVIVQESKKIGFVPTGTAAFTRGGSLKAEWVIHAVGPKYKDGKSGEAEKLESAVKAVMHIAEGKKLKRRRQKCAGLYRTDFQGSRRPIQEKGDSLL